MTTEIRVDTDHYLEVAVIDKNGDFVSGLSITYELRKSSNDALILNGILSEQTDIYVALININLSGQYRVIYKTPSKYENGYETLLVKELDLSDINILLQQNLDKTSKILGLSQSNYVLENPIYSNDGCLLSATQVIYETASDLENNINRLAEYEITASYVNGLLNKFISKEI